MGFVNWLTAPYGSTAYQPAGFEQYEGWYKKDANGEIEWWQINANGKEQWIWMGGRRDYPYGAIIRPAEAVTVKIELGNGALGAVAVDWSKAPEGTMGFHPQANGYVDHWVKWAENGDNWFCTCGFEANGWQNSIVKLSHMLPRYFSTIIVRPAELAVAERENFTKELFQLIAPEGKWHKLSEEAKASWYKAFDAGYRKTAS